MERYYATTKLRSLHSQQFLYEQYHLENTVNCQVTSQLMTNSRKLSKNGRGCPKNRARSRIDTWRAHFYEIRGA